ncbi:bifunctional diguanylate cyclase/phosphodiesterase [Marivivens donghaensis]|uniref:Bifunctional diguanylate cyclase/phosphodiesterase n=1 Tax=Marivivens donghaensis TaxID=1699413 RepID=A0ABX0VWZ2_9RHOB|nr:bifunctional diguanylate cyclase/phosphodiesterase [Marivivens donghaensis]NIY71806.1 bifunctional diguanylate cyclase/phosphodiesterase [Marivivens donghaensis]
MLNIGYNTVSQNLRRAIESVPLSVITPIGAFAGFEMLGYAGLVAGAAIPPVLLKSLSRDVQVDRVTDLMTRDAFMSAAHRRLIHAQRRRKFSTLFLIEIDRHKLLEEVHDRDGIEEILRIVAYRIKLNIRETDLISRMDGFSFAVMTDLSSKPDIEDALELASRIQQAIKRPLIVGRMNVHMTASIGFSMSDCISSTRTEDLLQATTNALIEAQRHGPSSVRSYSPAMRSRIEARNSLMQQVSRAFHDGEIRAFFQPQVSTVTGEITGFEALARWQHPDRGLIPPLDFLPAIAQANMMHRLGEVILNDTLEAITRWDQKGFTVPRVGVNFSSEELHAINLVDRIRCRVGSYRLLPDRIAVEVLETVVANQADEILFSNLSGLARLGCSLDLDDFGTGHASITSIRNYSVGRIKIDRSFVSGIDKDVEQQKMVAAILTMAERLGLQTLAEGVETSEERAKLAQLGCHEVQGYGIARPLAPELVDDWISNYTAQRISPPPRHLRAC